MAFYRDRLGFRVDTLWPPDAPELCVLDRDAFSIAFETTDFDGRAQPVMTGSLRVETTDVAGLHAEFVARGVAIEWGPEVYPYGRREFAVLDPEGYRLIFTEPTDDEATECG